MKKGAWIFLTLLLTLALSSFFLTDIKRNSTLINDISNDSINRKLEYPYINPADFDKFYGRLPRLYLHRMWKLKVVENPGKKPLGPGEYFFGDEGMSKGFWKADYDLSGWKDFYVPQRIMLRKNNDFGIKLINNNNKARIPNGLPPSRANMDVYAGDGFSYLAVDFTIPKEHKKDRSVLHFEAIDNLPVIYLNGKEVSRPQNILAGGAADPHWIDITSNVNPNGVNRLVVRTYNLFYDCEDFFSPHLNQNGVWYPAWIEFWPDLRSERMKIVPQYPSEIFVEIPVINAGKTIKHSLTAIVEPWKGMATINYDSSGKKWETMIPVGEYKEGDTTIVRFSMRLDGIKPWSPEHPYLHSLKITDNGKVIGWETFGMRTLRRDSKQHILINNTPVFLAGVSYEEGMFDEPYESEFYRGLFQGHTDGQMAMRLNKNGFMKRLLEFYRNDVNINSVVRGEIMPGVFYQLCDELGILRIDEPNLADNTALLGGGLLKNPYLMKGTRVRPDLEEIPATLRQWEVYSGSFIKTLYNHPSVIAWGIATEPFFSPRKWTEGIVNAVAMHKDSSRFVCGMNTDFGNREDGVAAPWGKDQGIRDVGIDYVFNRPFTYNGALGYEMVKSDNSSMFFWENRSREVYYSSGGGRPLLAAPILLQGQGVEAYPPTDKITSDLYNEKEGYNRKWLCRVLQEDSLYYWNARFIAKLTGVYNFISGNVWRERYIAFEQQRLAELFRINASLFRGFAACDVPLFSNNEKMFRGNVMDPEIITPGIVSESMKRAYQKVLPVLDWHFKTHLFAGEKVKYTLYVINDSEKDISPGEVKIRLLAVSGFADLKEIYAAKEVLVSVIKTDPLVPSEKFSRDVELAIPEGLNPGSYTIELTLKAGSLVTTNQYPVVIGNRSVPALKNDKKIAVYCAGRKQDDITRILKGMNVIHNVVMEFSSLKDYDILIIAPNSFDSTLIKNGSGINEWVLKGKKVLCLEQDYLGSYPFLKGYRTDGSNNPKKAGFHVAEPVRFDHPVLSGIGNIKDWDVLNGGLGNVYKYPIMPLDESVLMLGANTVDYYYKWVSARDKFIFGMALAECDEGKGKFLLSQILAVSRYDTDPVARRYLNQLLQYTVR